MADIERTVRNLRIRLEESPNERRFTMTIGYQVRVRPGPDGIDNYTITIPRLIDSKVDALLTNIRKIISIEDEAIRDLVVEKDVRINLQQIGEQDG